jgi:hypothetical protein
MAQVLLKSFWEPFRTNRLKGFYNYFYQQNEAIRNGSTKGVELQMDTLGVINGIIDEQIQAYVFTSRTYAGAIDVC